MSIYIIVLGFTSFYLVTYAIPPIAKGNIVTEVQITQFYREEAASVCNTDIKERIIKDLCTEFENTALPDAYSKQKIEEESGCHTVMVPLIGDRERRTRKKIKLGVCRLSSDMNNSICISGPLHANKRDELFLWNVNDLNFVYLCIPWGYIEKPYLRRTASATGESFQQIAGRLGFLGYKF